MAIKNFKQPTFKIEDLEKQMQKDLQQFNTIKAKDSSLGNGSYKRVYLVVGETGNGKSTTINAFFGEQVAQECKKGDINSQTKECSVYYTRLVGIALIDTPGYLDTDINHTEEQIRDKISNQVREHLGGDSQIDSVILVWNPSASGCKFRFDAILNNLKLKLGTDVLKSLVLLVNKRTERWYEDEEGEAVKAAKQLLIEKGLENVPVIVEDAKLNQQSLINQLKISSDQVASYREEQFIAHRDKCNLELIEKYLEKALPVRREKKELADRFIREGKLREAEYSRKVNEVKISYEKLLTEFKDNKERLESSLSKHIQQVSQLQQHNQQLQGEFSSMQSLIKRMEESEKKMKEEMLESKKSMEEEMLESKKSMEAQNSMLQSWLDDQKQKLEQQRETTSTKPNPSTSGPEPGPLLGIVTAVLSVLAFLL